MHTLPIPAPKTSAYVGEVSFAKTDNFIRGLVELQIGATAPRKLSLQSSECGAGYFQEVAGALLAKEQASTELPLALPVSALCDESSDLHPLNWLNVTERKKNDEQRQCHEWYVCLEDGEVSLTFEHGQYGYRRETFELWSAAFFRLAKLLAGTCSWHQFGDEQSQNTMLGKGQFYWQEPTTKEAVPVDNFIFTTPDGWELRIEGVSHRSVLSLSLGEFSRSEWFDDYSGALLRMAAIVEGTLPYEDFGQRDEDDADLPADATQPGNTWALSGRFVVRSIYTYGDEHPAPVLTYMTREMVQAQLATSNEAWVVQLCDAHRPWKSRRIPVNHAHNALRILAYVLKGTMRWDEFEYQL
jgi:hypothetical protein